MMLTNISACDPGDDKDENCDCCDKPCECGDCAECKEKMEEAYSLGIKFASDIKEEKAYPEQIAQIERGKRHFGEIIKKRKNDWTQEYQYWQDKGWI